MAQVGAFRAEPLTDNAPRACRYSLWMSAEAEANGTDVRVLIHNLSESGLLIESALELNVGEEFEVKLPEAGTTRAAIVWRSDSLYGCKFTMPVSGAAVSAARLRSPSSKVPEILAAPMAVPGNSEDSADPLALTPLQKLTAIVGLATACWVLITIAAALIYFAG